MAKKTRLEKLQEKEISLSTNLMVVRDEIRKEVQNINYPRLVKKYVGKCFKYTNRYSSGPNWNVYIKVLSVEKDGDLRGFIFESKHCFDEKQKANIEIESNVKIREARLGNEISTREFNMAYTRLLNSIKLPA